MTECGAGKLHGKVALVTGAGRGIGRAIAVAFAREGADIAICYSRERAGAEDAAAEARSLGARALVIGADVSDLAQVQGMIDTTVRELGRLDVLVNNAAVFSKAPVFDVTEDLWDHILGVNLKGAFFCSQAAARVMLQGEGGVILNLASGGGLSPTPGYDLSAAYAASKAGLVMLTKRLAIELAPKIRVNAIAPGVIDSKRKPMRSDVREQFSQQTPLKRVGDVGDIADAAVFLASDESDFVTGQVLSVDGGLAIC